MCEYAKQVMECDIYNGVKVGAMKHGEHLNIGVGKDTTIEIQAYTPDNDSALVYRYEIRRRGERVTLCTGANIYLLAAEYARLAMTNFD